MRASTHSAPRKSLDPGLRRDDTANVVAPAKAGAQRLWGPAILALSLTACAVGPRYAGPPPVDTPVAFKEGGGDWVPATAAVQPAPGPWWQAFGDADLDRLAPQVEVSNQNVAAAVAAYAQARALVGQQRAVLFPAITGTANTSRSDSSNSGASTGFSTGPRTANSLQIGATWEPDLWGRLARGVEGARTGAQASEADLAAARLAAQGELAVNLLNLRAADAQIALLQATVAGFERGLQIAGNRYSAGVVARTDVLQAQTQLANARASLAAQRQQRAQLEHAIAVLVGQPPARFALAPLPQWMPQVPAVPPAVPSTLLLRRPDVAAAERRVAQANEQIGIAQAAFFPRLQLTGAVGTSAVSVGDLFSAPTTLWSLGLAGTQLLFNAGLARSQVEAARAGYERTVAQYRQAVLVAFQGVEDQLVALRLLAEQQALRAEASRAADLVEQQVLNRYQAGQVGFTEVITAQQTALQARQALVQLQGARQVAAVALVQALGGGWGGLAP